ncbi:M20 family metallopeptidase [Solihabitans fulvus]|uniref:M20 family metallopeptidase n=2 Tax=Solihabitans fulvus TaxID=1892852 RepID=A0A5B2WXU8_9PSEU|nr:M20 family metallopeptidase [Solihabitans fulvus]
MDLDAFLGVATELLAVPSTADRPEDLRKALDLVLDFVGPGHTVERFESAGKPSALVYPGPTRPRFRVILNGHLDVVPAPPELFRPHRDGDRLHARGAQDMKVSALVQAQVFRELAGVLPYPIGLQLVTDEEIGGRNGTAHQLAQGVAAEFVVIGEHSGLRIVTESKGLVVARLLATGRAAHSAYQWLGDNAVLKLIRSIDAVLARYPVAAEEAWRSTVNVARIETSNTAYNQVPADALGWLDIRYPAADPDFAGRTPAEVAAHLAGLCEPGVEVHVANVDPPHRAEPDSVEVLALQRAAREQGYSGELLRKHGAADARFFHQRGIDAVIFGIGGDGQHGPDEYADVTTIVPYHRALTGFLRALT